MKQDLSLGRTLQRSSGVLLLRICTLAMAGLVSCVATTSVAAGRLACHDGIEPIRDPDSQMMQAIGAFADVQGDPTGCTVCHGGRLTKKIGVYLA